MDLKSILAILELALPLVTLVATVAVLKSSQKNQDKRLDELKTDIHELRGEIKDVNEKVSNLSATVGLLKYRQDKDEERLPAMKYKVSVK